MKLYRKFFLAADGKPVVGTRFGMLGVRPYNPAQPNRPRDVTAAAATDPVRPGGGGLSVFADPAAVTVQAAGMALCVIESDDLPPGLAAVDAGDPHWHVEPAAVTTLGQFQAALAGIRDLWAIV